MTRIRRCDLCGQAESQATDRNSSFWTDTQGWAKIERDYQIPEQADMDLCPTCVAAISQMPAHGYAWSIECVDHHGVRVAPGNVERGPIAPPNL